MRLPKEGGSLSPHLARRNQELLRRQSPNGLSSKTAGIIIVGVSHVRYGQNLIIPVRRRVRLLPMRWSHLLFHTALYPYSTLEPKIYSWTMAESEMAGVDPLVGEEALLIHSAKSSFNTNGGCSRPERWTSTNRRRRRS